MNKILTYRSRGETVLTNVSHFGACYISSAVSLVGKDFNIKCGEGHKVKFTTFAECAARRYI